MFNTWRIYIPPTEENWMLHALKAIWIYIFQLADLVDTQVSDSGGGRLGASFRPEPWTCRSMTENNVKGDVVRVFAKLVEKKGERGGIEQPGAPPEFPSQDDDRCPPALRRPLRVY